MVKRRCITVVNSSSAQVRRMVDSGVMISTLRIILRDIMYSDARMELAVFMAGWSSRN